jgi:glutaredoxin
MSVVIYGNNFCVYCRKAKKLASDYNLKYEWRDTDDQNFLNELKIKKPEARSIPQIWWNEKYIGGYEDFATAISNNIGGFGENSF